VWREKGTLDVDVDFIVGHGETETSRDRHSHCSTMSCDDCFKTVAHTGTPSGRTDSIAGVPTYIAEPTQAQNKILLYFADVFGPFYINNQLIQDWFASNGIHLSLHPAIRILTRTQATPSSASITSLVTGSRHS